MFRPYTPPVAFLCLQMVDWFYERGCHIIEDKLVKERQSGSKLAIEENRHFVKGVLRNIKPVNKLLYTTFPVRRDNGEFEVDIFHNNKLWQKLKTVNPLHTIARL